MPLYGGQRISYMTEHGLANSTLGIVLPKHEVFGRRFLASGHGVGEAMEAVYDVNGHVIGHVLINMWKEDTHIDLAIVDIAEQVPDDQLRPMQVGVPTPQGRMAYNLTGIAEPPAVGTKVDVVGAQTGHHVCTITELNVSVKRGEEIYRHLVVMMPDTGTDDLAPGDSGGPVYCGTTLIGLYGGAYSDEGGHHHCFMRINAMKGKYKDLW